MKRCQWAIMAFVGTLLFSQTQCSSTRPMQEGLRIELSERHGNVSKKWTRKFPGRITDLNLSADGSRVLVALVPDPDVNADPSRAIREPEIAFLDSRGEVLWKKPLEAREKWQTISPQADLILLTTYEGKFKAFDGKGRVLWEQENYCRPVILQKNQRIFCFRGDDAKPSGVGFDVYDFSGKRLTSYGIKSEVVDFSVSLDERWVVLALADGRIQLIDTKNLQLRWEATLPTLVVSVAVSSEDSPRVAVFTYQRSEAGRHLATAVFFDHEGKRRNSVPLDGRFDQMAMSPNGTFVVLSGNNPQGQALATLMQEPGVLPLDPSPTVATQSFRYKEVWRQRVPRYSDYSSPLAVMQDRIIIGFEEMPPAEPGETLAHLYAFDPKGKVEWSLPLIGQEGGYLFAYSRGKDNPMLVSVSDMGEMSAYDLE